MRAAFKEFLEETNAPGSGKASSYLRAIDLLEQMLRISPGDYEEGILIWDTQSVKLLTDLRERVLEEQRKGTSSEWVSEGIPKSYLRDGYCSAALTQLIHFVPEFKYNSEALDLYRNHEGDEAELPRKIQNLEFDTSNDAASRDGEDRDTTTTRRVGQKLFRNMVFDAYQNRCCITGLDIPTVNRASHIIGWAERKGTRLDPRNGLCLSATYDAAFDRKLISLDEDYRLIISRDIKDHYTGETVRAHFQNKEGSKVALPSRFQPLQSYLSEHRNAGQF